MAAELSRANGAFHGFGSLIHALIAGPVQATPLGKAPCLPEREMAGTSPAMTRVKKCARSDRD